MAVTRLERKGRKNKTVAKKRVNAMKRLSTQPVIKNVDVEAIKAEFDAAAAKPATAKKEKAPAAKKAKAEPKEEVKAEVAETKVEETKEEKTAAPKPKAKAKAKPKAKKEDKTEE